MGLRDLFSSKKKPPPPTVVGFYGKLPSAGDFLRLNASGSEVQLLDRWLSEAIATAERTGDDWQEVYSRAATLSFMLHDESGKSGRCVLGSMVPSRDQIGRRFPMVVFSALDQHLVQEYPALPHHEFIRDIKALLGGCERLTRDTLAASVGRVPPPDSEALDRARTAHESYMVNTDCGAAFHPVFFGRDPAQIGRALDTLRSACSSLTSPTAVPRFGLRCPLGGPDPSQVAGLWLDLQRHWTPLNLLPQLLWTDEVLVIYFRQPASRSLNAVWRPAWQHDSICDLATSDSGGAEGAPPPHTPLRTLLH